MSSSNFSSPSETIERLGISYSTFLRQIKAGRIPHVKIGKQIRIPESFFQRLEAEGTVKAGAND